jgi:hypothetical protein
MQSEPHKQWQNPAERRIQEIKSMTNIVMDRSGAPAYLWLLCMTHCVFTLNHLACDSLGDVCPIQAAFGYTPDISIILLAYFYQPILYYDYEAPFSLSKEKSGHMVGFAENKGDALTFLILTDNTGEFITTHSVIRPAADIENPNLQLFPESGEISISDYKDLVHRKVPSKLDITSEAEVVELSERNLPTVDPIEIIGRTFLLDREIDGTVHRAEVLCRVEQVDGETEQYLVRLGDGRRQEVMTYDAIIDALDHHLE